MCVCVRTLIVVVNDDKHVLTSLAKTSNIECQAEPLVSLPREKANAKKPNLVSHPYAQWWPMQRFHQTLLPGSTSQRKSISTSYDGWFMTKGNQGYCLLFLPSHCVGTKSWEVMESKVLRQLPNTQGKSELCWSMSDSLYIYIIRLLPIHTS